MPSNRERIIALVKQSPHLNQTEIAEQLGISRQRVAQIVADEGLNAPKGKRGVAPRKSPTIAEAAPAPPRDAIPGYLANAGGPIAVLIAAADLMARGFTVYMPIVPSGAADLVTADRRGKLERVSVQRAQRKAGDKLEYSYPKPGDVERHALILTDEPVRYEPRLPEAGNKILRKTFPGGHLTPVGANSATGLASRPRRK